MDIIFNRAVVNKVQKISEQLENIKSMSSFEPKWSDPAPIDSIKISEGLGVYRIIYKPTGMTMYIGQGWVFVRRSKHKRVFLNSGKAIIHPSGSVTDSPAGRKMFEYDTDIDNWLFQFCFIPSKQLCCEYEKGLQEDEEPEFNDQSMAGKG